MTPFGFPMLCRSPWGRSRSCSHSSDTERGASAVEFALVLPAMVVILFGIFDFGRAFLATHGLTAGAREGARMAIAARPVTDSEVESRVQDFLNDTKVESPSITISPSVSGVASGTAITVTATSTFQMSILPMTFTLRGSATMVKE